MLDYNYESQSLAAYIVMYIAVAKERVILLARSIHISMLHVLFPIVSRLIQCHSQLTITKALEPWYTIYM